MEKWCSSCCSATSFTNTTTTTNTNTPKQKHTEYDYSYDINTVVNTHNGGIFIMKIEYLT